MGFAVRTSAVWISAVLALVLFPACSQSPEDEAADLREVSQSQCVHARNVARDMADGVLTVAEMRDKFREVESAPDPAVSAAARKAVAAATADDVPLMTEALAELDAACAAIGA